MLSTFTMSILLGILTFILILVSIFLILVVLMQKAKTDGGVGAALGGGMTEAAFGADTNNVLTTLTKNLTIAFFLLSFTLYLGHIYQRNHSVDAAGALPTISDLSTPTAPATEPATSPSVTIPTATTDKTAETPTKG